MPSAYAMLALMTQAQLGASVIQQGLGALAPFFATAYGLSHASLGIAFAALAAGSATTTAISGVLVDRLGERRVVLWSGLVVGLFTIFAGAWRNYAYLTCALAAVGIGYGASTPAGGRAILLWFERGRGFAMGVRQTGVPLGGAVGAILLPFVAVHFGYRGALAVGGVIGAATALFAYARYREPQGTKAEVRHTREIVSGMLDLAVQPRIVLLNLTGALLVSTQYASVTFLSVYFIARHESLLLASTALAVFQLAAGLARLFWGMVSDRWFGGERTQPLILLCILCALTLWWLSAMPAAAPAYNALAIAAAVGACCGGWNGLFSALQAEIGGVSAAGSALGVGLTYLYGTGIVAPPLFGAVVDHFGFALAWQALAIVVALGAIPAVLSRGMSPSSAAR
ncbi:MAG: MFS transporter [bacterium]|nr:MFS transporter [bacterium]